MVNLLRYLGVVGGGSDGTQRDLTADAVTEVFTDPVQVLGQPHVSLLVRETGAVNPAQVILYAQVNPAWEQIDQIALVAGGRVYREYTVAFRQVRIGVLSGGVGNTTVRVLLGASL